MQQRSGTHTDISTTVGMGRVREEDGMAGRMGDYVLAAVALCINNSNTSPNTNTIGRKQLLYLVILAKSIQGRFAPVSAVRRCIPRTDMVSSRLLRKASWKASL